MKSVGDSHRIIAQVEDMSKERAIKALNLPERLWTIRFYLMDKMELRTKRVGIITNKQFVAAAKRMVTAHHESSHSLFHRVFGSDGFC